MRDYQQYLQLVTKRKACSACSDLNKKPKMHNGQEILGDKDSQEIGPWLEVWKVNSLDADILVLGQDWGSIKEYKEYGLNKEPYGITDDNLEKLLKEIDPASHLSKGNTGKHKYFFTNLILCYKEGGISAKIPACYYDNCRTNFFNELLEIIQPKVIITLGRSVLMALSRDDSFKNANNIALSKTSFNSIIDAGFNNSFYYRIKDKTIPIIPIAHTGGMGTANRNRGNKNRAANDWKTVAKIIESI